MTTHGQILEPVLPVDPVRRATFTVLQSQTLNTGFQLLDRDGRAYPITDVTEIKISVVSEYAWRGTLFELTYTGGDLAVDDAAKGEVYFDDIAAATVQGWPAGRHKFVLTLTDPTGTFEHGRGIFEVIEGSQVATVYEDLEIGSPLTIEARRSADFIKRFRLLDRGVPISLSGATLALVVSRTVEFGTALASLSVGSGITVDDSAGGLITCTIDQSTLDGWPAGAFVYTFTITQGGVTRDLAYGAFVVAGAALRLDPTYTLIDLTVPAPRRLDIATTNTGRFDRKYQLVKDGAPFDLSTVTEIIFSIRPDYDYATAIDTLTQTGGDIDIDSASLGKISISVPKVTTDDWPKGDWRWLMTLQATGVHEELGRGRFVIHGGDVS